MQTAYAEVNNIGHKAARAPAGGRPPVIVLNMFYSGLGIARQLSGTGVRVVGLSAHPKIYGNFSRLCEVRRAPNSQDRPEELAEFLLQISAELSGGVVFPTRDADILFLDRFRSVLGKLYKLAVPLPGVLEHLLDKSKLIEMAGQAEIPVPRTMMVEQSGELERAAELVGFPCIVKPRTSIHWRATGNWSVVGNRKGWLAANLAELQQTYDRVSKANPEVLVQEWIPGAANQLVIWAGYIPAGGARAAHFTARKILQCPNDCGTGCIVESELLPELLEPSLRLCNALGHSGIAEIEYKYDSRDGRFKLIEINPRHWDWHELGRGSGVNVTLAAYNDLTGQNVRVSTPIVRRARWVAEDALVLHFLSAIYRKEYRLLKDLKKLWGKRLYGIFSWNDPMPFLRYCISQIAVTLSRAVLTKPKQRLMVRRREHILNP